MVTIKPSLLPPPVFKRKPRIRQRGDSLVLDYSPIYNPSERKERGGSNNFRDESRIEWLRDGIVVSTTHDAPQRSYHLTKADANRTITAVIEPKSNRSDYGPPVCAVPVPARNIGAGPVPAHLVTNFHDFPCQWQPEIIDGYWTVDGFKPKDTEAYDWNFDATRPMWEYGEGFNGAVGKGLLQAQRGARLMYTPVAHTYTDMSLTLHVDPTKTAGQGFGSATGQYMDVCLKFDTRTLTGYGLRIIRTVKYAKAVDFMLVEYKNGIVNPLTAPVSATCYRTGCTITIAYTENGNIGAGRLNARLTASVETTTPKPADSTLPHSVSLAATVTHNTFGGIHIQHTGSCGESTTMLHSIEATWTEKDLNYSDNEDITSH